MTDQPPPSTNEQNVISEEDFIGFNSLIENGDTEALESFITDKSITPEIYYQYFQSHYVYKRCCAVGLAAKCGQVDVMKNLISFGFSVNENSFHFDNVRPIHLACEAGNLAVVKSLVEDYGVDISHRDNCYSKPTLCRAASNGRLGVIQYFVENETDVNARYGVHGTSMLHSAAEDNQSEVCEYLLSKGADVDICNIYKVTPLILAARFGNVCPARVLLDTGADVNFMDNDEQTPFLNAAENGHINMMKFLASHGADPDQYDRFNNSALHHAVTDNDYDMTHYLVIELNISLEVDEDCDETPFRIALRESKFDMVDLLVRAGYNPVEEVEEFYEDSEDENENDDVEAKVPAKLKKIRCYVPKNRRTELQKKLKELNHIVKNPRSLQALSVYTVRRLLNRRLSTDVDRLPICEPLKKIVMYCVDTV